MLSCFWPIDDVPKLSDTSGVHCLDAACTHDEITCPAGTINASGTRLPAVALGSEADGELAEDSATPQRPLQSTSAAAAVATVCAGDYGSQTDSMQHVTVNRATTSRLFLPVMSVRLREHSMHDAAEGSDMTVESAAQLHAQHSMQSHSLAEMSFGAALPDYMLLAPRMTDAVIQYEFRRRSDDMSVRNAAGGARGGVLQTARSHPLESSSGSSARSLEDDPGLTCCSHQLRESVLSVSARSGDAVDHTAAGNVIAEHLSVDCHHYMGPAQGSRGAPEGETSLAGGGDDGTAGCGDWGAAVESSEGDSGFDGSAADSVADAGAAGSGCDAVEARGVTGETDVTSDAGVRAGERCGGLSCDCERRNSRDEGGAMLGDVDHVSCDGGDGSGSVAADSSAGACTASDDNGCLLPEQALPAAAVGAPPEPDSAAVAGVDGLTSQPESRLLKGQLGPRDDAAEKRRHPAAGVEASCAALAVSAELDCSGKIPAHRRDSVDDLPWAGVQHALLAQENRPVFGLLCALSPLRLFVAQTGPVCYPCMHDLAVICMLVACV